MSNSNPGLFAGIDVGGTNIKMGVVDADGHVLAETSFPTEDQRGPADAVERMRQRLNALLSELNPPRTLEQLLAVGLGTPGTLDIKGGMILEPPNLPGWRHFPIRDEIATVLAKPVTYTNDANAAAFGEFWLGGGKQHDSLTLLTLGTGVGGGLVVNGRLVQGATGNAAELGHLCVDYATDARLCSCGLPGHLEAYASASAVAARAIELARQVPDGRLAHRLAAAGRLSARDVYEQSAQGDLQSRSIVMETAEWIARGITMVAHVIDPEIVILGGAMDFGGEVSPVGLQFLERIQRLVRERTFSQVAEKLIIEFAQLGSAAGWIGAAGLARQSYDSSFEAAP